MLNSIFKTINKDKRGFKMSNGGIELKEILRIVQNYMDKSGISLGEYAREAGCSKAWLSKLLNEKSKSVSIEIAARLLGVAGYNIRIGGKIVKNRNSRLAKKK